MNTVRNYGLEHQVFVEWHLIDTGLEELIQMSKEMDEYIICKEDRVLLVFSNSFKFGERYIVNSVTIRYKMQEDDLKLLRDIGLLRTEEAKQWVTTLTCNTRDSQYEL
jgi:hypothetical protein